MPFNHESASKAGTKSKRGPVKHPPVKTKMAQLFEDLIADLFLKQRQAFNSTKNQTCTITLKLYRA
jgi:hypothetical protein